MGEKKVWTAELSKGEDQLFTAWWYENAQRQTPNDWDWRWLRLQGEQPFYLINISCNSMEELRERVGAFELFGEMRID